MLLALLLALALSQSPEPDESEWNSAPPAARAPLPVLVPSAEVEAKLQELELQRAPLEVRHSRAFALRLSAGIGYGLAAICIAWGIAEFVLIEQSKGSGPLSGARYQAPVPPAAMAVTGVVLAVISAALHAGGRQISLSADEDEEALDSETRRLRRKLAAPQSD